MAITPNPMEIVNDPVGGYQWFLSMYSANLSGCEELLAAVTGSCHYVNRITINTISSINVSVGGGETAGALTNTYIGPVGFTAAGPNFILDFGKKFMKIPISTALNVVSSGAGATWVYVEGKTCKEP